jgi:replicative DNA helicase
LKEIDHFAVEVEKQLGPGGDFESMGDWAGKLVGAVCRIAGIFHGLIYARSGNPSRVQVDPETMLGAIAIGEYLIPHAKAAFFEMGADPAIDIARKIQLWVLSKRISEFSKR